jgi:tetratricopeptide (TPR) repeat protein
LNGDAALADGAAALAGDTAAEERPQPAALLLALQQAEDRLEGSAASEGNERLLAACRQLGELHRSGLAPQVGALARELAAAGHVEPARGLWLALQQALPDSPVGWVGQANLATQQHRWEEAMDGWSRALERFPDRNQPVWKLGLARAMHRLGLNDEAAEFLRQALALHPDALGVRHMLVNVLDKTGHLPAALALIDERLDDCLADLQLQFQHLKLLTRLGQRERAVDTAHRLLADASSVDWLPGIVRMLPEMACGHPLAQLIDHARMRLDEFAEGGLSGRCSAATASSCATSPTWPMATSPPGCTPRTGAWPSACRRRWRN